METRFGQYNTPQGSLMLPRDITFDFSGLDPFEPNLDLYTVGTTQLFPVGTQLNDGFNKFRYVEFGETTAVGDLVEALPSTNAHDVLDPTGTATDPFGTGAAATTAGATVIAFADSITLVVNEYSGGTARVEENVGKGYTYRILRNTAVSSAANGAIEISGGGLGLALSSTSNLSLVRNKYSQVKQGNVTQLGVNVGVANCIGADDSFGWLATQGPWGVLSKGTLVIGDPATNVTTAASAGPWAAVTTPLLGHVVDPAESDTLIALVDLQLDGN